jgi:hypothetical protein
VIHPGEEFLVAQLNQGDSYGPAMAVVEVQFLSQAQEVMLLEGLSTPFAPDAFPYLAPQLTLDPAGTCVKGQDSVLRIRRKSGVCRQSRQLMICI